MGMSRGLWKIHWQMDLLKEASLTLFPGLVSTGGNVQDVAWHSVPLDLLSCMPFATDEWSFWRNPPFSRPRLDYGLPLLLPIFLVSHNVYRHISIIPLEKSFSITKISSDPVSFCKR
jgi:hypothetical protein